MQRQQPKVAYRHSGVLLVLVSENGKFSDKETRLSVVSFCMDASDKEASPHRQERGQESLFVNEVFSSTRATGSVSSTRQTRSFSRFFSSTYQPNVSSRRHKRGVSSTRDTIKKWGVDAVVLAIPVKYGVWRHAVVMWLLASEKGHENKVLLFCDQGDMS